MRCNLIKWIASVTACFVICLLILGNVFSPDLPTAPKHFDPDEVDKVEESRKTALDLENPPRIQVDVNYSQGREAEWFPKGEAPVLRDLVREHQLPSVEDRVGEEPLVLKGIEGNGIYGGTWFRLAASRTDIEQVNTLLSTHGLVRWSPQGYPIVPNIAKSWSSNEDYTIWTFHLRRGMKWSDGEPFTTTDILYWYNEHMDYLFIRKTEFMIQRGTPGQIEADDPYTLRFIFKYPYPNLLEKLAGEPCYIPRHYLAPFNPKIGGSERIKAEMNRRGMSSELFLYRFLNGARDFDNFERPRISPWILTQRKANPPITFVRNPYYWAVDSDGNQLPYIDRLHFQVKDQKILPIAASNGEATFQDRGLDFQDYTLLMSQRKTNDYQVFHWYSAAGSDYALWPNRNRTVNSRDPASAQKARFLDNPTFLQALSIAIDRNAIIRGQYSGQTRPSQLSPGPGSPHHFPELSHRYTEYQPDKARKLLDSLGMTERDEAGYRRFPDGSRMTWFLTFSEYSGSGPVQFIVDDWADVGIRAIPRERTRTLLDAELRSGEADFLIWPGNSDFFPFIQSSNFAPSRSFSYYAKRYGIWYGQGGLQGDPDALLNGALEPPRDHPMRRSLELLDEALYSDDLDLQQNNIYKILELAVDNLYSISLSTPPPQPVVVKNNLHNVPKLALAGYLFRTPANTYPETYYLDNGKDTPRIQNAIRQELLSRYSIGQSENPNGAKGTKHSMEILARILQITFILLIITSLLLVAFRHPFIGKRLLLMIPTLLIISFLAFTIIQLPPGSFVETKITELQLEGNISALREIEALEKDFYLDRPFLERYSRWMGLHWFVTFSKSDRGLLQGYLGKSMDNSKPVNDLVGDRILLTLFISAGSILLTWCIAIPIGIFSAVKQYSYGDYFFTILGFIGMSLPGFLLALLLMHASAQWFGVNSTGLFSPEFAAQPNWTLPKLYDLLKHIWLPVVVLGVSGTAAMIRVMRGNLLDELKRPYVTTARAKGVRPLKLLLKYPVRLALNPFISGVGHLFPQLISGGAIVAMVLSLPTVGPLMLKALMTEDFYMAGSLLFVLSTLGVLGTLVSDLLLLWLDPRIRMGGN